MAGSEVMMFTNKEIVANLSANNGRTFTESFPLPEGNKYREADEIVALFFANSNYFYQQG